MNQRDDAADSREKAEFHGEFENEFISLDRFHRWMDQTEIGVQATVFDIMTNSERVARVVPPPSLEDRRRFIPKYLSRCMRENPTTEPALSRWEAASQFLVWFVGIWDDVSIDKSVLSETKNQLRDLYLAGDLDVRKALIQATLEHLFENASVRLFFADWRDDPQLRGGYEQAAEWSRSGGHTGVAPQRER